MRPTTLEKLAHTRPVLKALLEGESPAVAKPLKYFRVQFAVDRVKPRDLPPFPYVTSKINFDCLVYTAILQATGLGEAVAEIKRYWPDAQPRTAQENRDSFDAEDSHLPSVTFGSTSVQKKRSIFRGWSLGWPWFVAKE